MARYVDDYQGIVGHDVPPRGMDPNFRGVYGGMRMRGGRGQAEYGRYRLQHPEDFGGSGGFAGRYGAHGVAPGRRREVPREPGVGYGREWGSGGVREIRYDRELLHDFNANSPALEPRRGPYDVDTRSRLRRGVAPWSRGPGGHPWYSNRGISDAGYSEGWAWGPMRGSR